jgi:hypothetical protein
VMQMLDEASLRRAIELTEHNAQLARDAMLREQRLRWLQNPDRRLAQEAADRVAASYERRVTYYQLPDEEEG